MAVLNVNETAGNFTDNSERTLPLILHTLPSAFATIFRTSRFLIITLQGFGLSILYANNDTCLKN
jgi:hypothetical protein